MLSLNWLIFSILALHISRAFDSIEASPLQHLYDIDRSYADSVMTQFTSPRFDTEPPIEEVEGDDAETPTMSTVTTEQVSPIVSSLLETLHTALVPLLGALAPLANVIGPMIGPSVTQTVTNAVNGLLGASNRHALGQINGYNSYVINIPDQGTFLLLTKHSLRAPHTPLTHESLQANVVNTVGTISTNQAANVFGDALEIPNIAATPITNTLLDNLKHVEQAVSQIPVRPVHVIPKRRVIRRKQQAFLIPLSMVHAAQGNLNTFAKSRSSNPLTDFQVDVY